MPIDLLCLDADDTLWHNMRHFEAAEAILHAMLAPFGEEVSRARLADVETRNLATYGYGAKSFTLSMIETAIEVAGDRLTAADVAAILHAGRDLLAHPVEVLPGVAEVLAALNAQVRLVLVTKGDLLHQEAKLAASGLGDLFEAVDIVSDKTAETFARIFGRHEVAPERAMMAGDSLRSDVLPALAAGAWGTHIPHAIVWNHERADAPAEHPKYRRLDSIAALPALIASLA